MDFRFRPLSKCCAATGREFRPGEVVRSVLVDGDEDLQRFDYCTEALAEVPTAPVASWSTVVPEPAAIAKGLDADEQFRRFELLAEEDAPHQGPLTYVLALWLIRRRRLRIDGQEVIDDVSRLNLSGTRGEGPFAIRDQTLTGGQVEQLQAALFDSEPPSDGEPSDGPSSGRTDERTPRQTAAEVLS